MYPIARPLAALALVGIVASACGGATATPTPAPAAPTPTPAPVATPAPSPTPRPTTDGRGPEYVTGYDSHSGTGGTEVKVGDVTQVRNVVIAAKLVMNDPRVSGTGTGLVHADKRGTVGPEWGTTRIENAAGAWAGTVTGALWTDPGASQQTSDLSGWLVGSGAYEGYTYYWHLRALGGMGVVDGIIYPGSPPAP